MSPRCQSTFWGGVFIFFSQTGDASKRLARFPDYPELLKLLGRNCFCLGCNAQSAAEAAAGSINEGQQLTKPAIDMSRGATLYGLNSGE